MGYYARIYTNSDSAQGVTVRVFSIDLGDFIADVPYDPYNSEGTYVWIDSGPVEFVMELDSGYKFYRWAYRVGSLSATLQYDYEDIYFYYTDEVDIIVRPEAVIVQTVPVFIDFSTEEIYRMRIYYYDETGEEVSSGYMYEPTYLYVMADTELYISRVTLVDGVSPPVICTVPDGTVQTIIDETGYQLVEYLPVDDWGGTYWFQTGSGGDAPDYGSFVERTVWIDGLQYVPYISDGKRWYEYKTLIAE